MADGCLGLRRSQDIAFPTFIAARVETRKLFSNLADAWGTSVLSEAGLMSHLDAETGQAEAAFHETLSPGESAQAQALLSDARALQDDADAG